MIAQTRLPKRWIVVSDGSTDNTDALVRKRLPAHPWMRLIRIDSEATRNFASKARSFNAGYQSLEDFDYDIVGNLDADVSFEPDYFERLIGRFDEDPDLGVAGTSFKDDSLVYNYSFVGLDHVSGICQLFRRECMKELGGYRHIKGGGVDLVAVTTARMNGWKTRTFPEIECRHHRDMGTGMSGPVRLRFRGGAEDYYLGSHPVWELLRCMRHFASRPYVIGALSIYAGYLGAYLRRHPRPVAPEFVQFRRREQMRRLKGIMSNFLVPGRS